jgi:hypothetical protein
MFEHRIFFHVFDGIHFNLIPDPRPQPPLLLHLHRLPQERAGTADADEPQQEVATVADSAFRPDS